MPDNLKEQLDRFFNSMRDRAVISVFNHEHGCGFCVRWAEQGTGFGEFTIGLRKDTGEVFVDTEDMGPEWIGNMLMRLVGTEVKDELKEWQRLERQARERHNKGADHGSDA